jgi:short-subunit dehydrogenase
MERVLVLGASGHIGVSAVIAALRSKREVLAVVRSQASAEKLFHHVGTKDGITIAEADVTSTSDLQTVVDRVVKGDLPPFHHVYAASKHITHCSPHSC